MSDQMEAAILSGMYRRKKMTATYQRINGRWNLSLTVGGKASRHRLEKSGKPCWTIALKFAEELYPPKSRTSKPKPVREPGISQTEGWFRVVRGERE